MDYFFKVVAVIILAWGFIVCLSSVFNTLGFFGGVLALFFFPITLFLVPWYEGLINSNWFPLFMVYGGGAVAFFLFSSDKR